jgi:hypothetical protein
MNDILQISGKFQSNYFIIKTVTSSSSSHKLFPDIHFSIIFLICVPAFYVLYERPNTKLLNRFWKFWPVFEENTRWNVVKTVILPSGVPILILNINWRKQKRTEFHGIITFAGTKISLKFKIHLEKNRAKNELSNTHNSGYRIIRYWQLYK